MMAKFTFVSKVSELSPGEQKETTVDGRSLLLVNVDGNFYAIRNICSHLECPLFGGILEGKILMCLCHGSRFDVTNGEVIKGPAQESLSVYEVKLDGTDILVGLLSQ